ncbi:MAG: hypothetical protein Q8N23_16205 [Archangium sp.]|nr:hypothetical protein [Archangium sp.]MDP3575908.1 hypothetical protein [Archangium sp.]
MRRFWLLTLLLLPEVGRTEEAAISPELREARRLMFEGLERDLTAPTMRGPPQWPTADEAARAVPRGEPGAKRVEALGERVRNEASTRARALAEERRTVPDNQPGAAQSRTRAAKAMGPKPKPPKP